MRKTVQHDSTMDGGISNENREHRRQRILNVQIVSSGLAVLSLKCHVIFQLEMSSMKSGDQKDVGGEAEL